jgi:hypothetical protein
MNETQIPCDVMSARSCCVNSASRSEKVKGETAQGANLVRSVGNVPTLMSLHTQEIVFMSHTQRTAWDERGEMIVDLNRVLHSPSEVVEVVSLPTDLAAVLTTGRTELLALVEPRALSKDECAMLYKLFEVLIKTNFALQAHARETARMVEQINGMVRGLLPYASRTALFADFKNPQQDDNEGGE